MINSPEQLFNLDERVQENYNLKNGKLLSQANNHTDAIIKTNTCTIKAYFVQLKPKYDKYDPNTNFDDSIN